MELKLRAAAGRGDLDAADNLVRRADSPPPSHARSHHLRKGESAFLNLGSGSVGSPITTRKGLNLGSDSVGSPITWLQQRITWL